MKIAGALIIVICGFILGSCKQSSSKTETIIEQTEKVQQTDTIEFVETNVVIDHSKEKEMIQQLIRETLKWANSKHAIDILPVLTDSVDSVYIGFDLDQHKSNLDKLRATDFFANQFIENYNQIILTLDKKFRNHEFGEWFVGDLSPFSFANGANPWCDCQDTPYDNPNPWEHVEIVVLDLKDNTAELIWKWRELESNMDSGWNEFSYRFNTIKENGKWKIAYLQEFDFEKSIR